MQQGRDIKGRFIKGNTIAYQGWLGLVNKRFGGDVIACKTWFTAVRTLQLEKAYKVKNCTSLEQFLHNWQATIQFSMGDDEFPF